MVNKETIEKDLVEAMKAKNSVRVETLRGLKTRLQNEQIAKGRALETEEMIALLRSEVKRRKESASAFSQGGRSEMAEKELAEVTVISEYLPQEPTEDELRTGLDQVLSEQSFTIQQMGAVMGKMKQKFPNADGSVLAQLVKEKLS